MGKYAPPQLLRLTCRAYVSAVLPMYQTRATLWCKKCPYQVSAKILAQGAGNCTVLEVEHVVYVDKFEELPESQMGQPDAW